MALPISLEALRVLDAIERRGSFAAAAEELHKVTSAVSYAVQKLEQDLDMLLFDRQGHRAQLTPAGKVLLEQGRAILEATELMVEQARQVANGWESRLSLAVDCVIPVLPILETLGRFYRESGANTDLRLQEEVLGGGWDALESGRADMLIAPLLADRGQDMPRIELGYIHFAYVAAPDHPLCQEPQPITPEQRRQHRAIVVADTSRNRPPMSSGLVEQQATLTVSNFASKIAALEAGMGTGYLPCSLAREAVLAGRLKVLPVADPREPIPVVLIWRPGASGRGLDWFRRNLPEVMRRVLQDDMQQRGRASL
ncbi:LysR substrate-binding domain-containing protein [Balneatrix alpica]|uniref:LysR substrate-binding domain-containing protein n=1 Tax=Balneatrix alpica TaxID=75684 RepID=UPI000688354C|nr:LysR substrate-binding domain-containing protein [Balneatrix alpica]